MRLPRFGLKGQAPPPGGQAFFDCIERVQADMAGLGHSAHGLNGSEPGSCAVAAILLSAHVCLADVVRTVRGPSGPDVARRLGAKRPPAPRSPPALGPRAQSIFRKAVNSHPVR
jgi:hypothetical protein